ncbi:transposase [Sinorhizobium mexicanum]|uniref:Transposase n=1 Tax=Sinorhizobium mexicanum TaxID=375549 RepID=A0A859QPT1_9HYPH|nr:transposase [Sinorhizobium mexicanum]
MVVGRSCAQILAEAFAPGAVASEVARRFEVSTGRTYTWRRQALVQQAEPDFVPTSLLTLPAVMRSSWPWQWTARTA